MRKFLVATACAAAMAFSSFKKEPERITVTLAAARAQAPDTKARIEELIKQMENGKLCERIDAVEKLGELARKNPGESGLNDAIPGLIEFCYTMPPHTAKIAANTLVEIGEQAVQPLLKATKGQYGDTTIPILGRIAERYPKAAKQVVPEFVRLLNECQHMETAGYALADIGESAAPALEQANYATCYEGLGAIEITLKAIWAIKRLPDDIRNLKDPEVSVRLDAAGHIEDIARVHPRKVWAAVPRLIEAAGNPGSGLQKVAISALGNSGDPRAIAALAKTMKSDKNTEIRGLSALELGYTRNAAALPPLLEALVDPVIGSYAAGVISDLGFDGKDNPARCELNPAVLKELERAERRKPLRGR